MPNLKAVALLAMAVLATLLIFWYLLPLVIPFLIAVLISMLMEPVIARLQRNKYLSRNLAVGLTMLTTFIVIGILITLMVLRLGPELNKLSKSFDDYMHLLQVILTDLVREGQAFYGSLSPAVTKQIQQFITALTEQLNSLIRPLLDSLVGLVTAIPGIILFIIIILVGTYFISRDKEAIRIAWLNWVPEPWGPNILAVSRKVTRAFIGYIRAQLILVAITTTQSIIGLYIIGAQFAVTVGLLIGFFDLIPVLGPSTIFIPWIIWSFAFGSISFGIKLTVLYLLVFIVRAVLEPRIVAANVGLHPLTALVAMYIGLKTMGVLGLVVGPIFMVAVQAAFKAGREYWKIK